MAGLLNALKVVGKKKEDVKIVTSGAGAAAVSIVKLLLSAGFKNVVMTDRTGPIYAGREHPNWQKEAMAQFTPLPTAPHTLQAAMPAPDAHTALSPPCPPTPATSTTMHNDTIS